MQGRQTAPLHLPMLTRMGQSARMRQPLPSDDASSAGRPRRLLRSFRRPARILGEPGSGSASEGRAEDSSRGGAPRSPASGSRASRPAPRSPAPHHTAPRNATPRRPAAGPDPGCDGRLAGGRRAVPLGWKLDERLRLLGTDPVGLPPGRHLAPALFGAQWSYGRRVSRRALAPGDLVFFSGLGHVGIYLGHGAVIHAPSPGERVRFEWMGGWLSSSFYGARRLRLAD